MTWCDRCDWNVDPSPPEEKYGPLESRRRKLAQRHGEKLLAEVTGGGSLSPHRSTSSVTAFLLALSVHAFTLAVVVAGGCFLVRGWATAWMVPGVVSLALAWTLLLRFSGLPEGDPVLRRAQAPELFALIDEVGVATGTRGADAVVLDTAVNACVTTYGLRACRSRLASTSACGGWACSGVTAATRPTPDPSAPGRPAVGAAHRGGGAHGRGP